METRAETGSDSFTEGVSGEETEKKMETVWKHERTFSRKTNGVRMQKGSRQKSETTTEDRG